MSCTPDSSCQARNSTQIQNPRGTRTFLMSEIKATVIGSVSVSPHNHGNPRNQKSG